MGNCIASTHYVNAAASGRLVLLAVRTPEGAIAANVDLRRTKLGWRVQELQARFDRDPEEQLVRQVRDWAGTLVRVSPEPEAPGRAVRGPTLRARPPASTRRLREIGVSLQEHLVHAAGMPSAVHARQKMAGLAAWMPGAAAHTEAGAALTALRRVGVCTLARAVEQSLRAEGGSSLTDLWNATADRPLQRAIAALPPGGAQRLQPLLFDAPLPGSLRPLARMPHLAPARTSHLVALRLRRALAVLIGQDSPELARAITSNPDSGLIRAAVLAVTSHGGIPLRPAGPPGLAAGPVTAISLPRCLKVPAYPASSLDDNLWQSAMPDAVELGATPETFWEHVAAHGALVPTSWIPHSWPVLWARALNHRP
jgi:hypothetical protein